MYTLEQNREFFDNTPIDKFVKILGKTYTNLIRCFFPNVTIKFVNSLMADAATDGKSVIYILHPKYSDFMSKLTNEELALYLLGVIAHELFHMFWTDVSYLSAKLDRIEAGEYSKEYPNLTKFCRMTPMATQVIHGFCNITEDAHVNRSGKKEFPRYVYPLSFVYKLYNRMMKPLSSLTREDGSINELVVFLEFANYFAIRGKKPDLTDVPEDLKKICISARRPIMDIVYENDTRERTNASLEYFDKVLPELIDLSDSNNNLQSRAKTGSDASQAVTERSREQNSSSSTKEKPTMVPSGDLERKDHEDEKENQSDSQSERFESKDNKKAGSEAKNEETGSEDSKSVQETSDQEKTEDISEETSSCSAPKSEEPAEDGESEPEDSSEDREEPTDAGNSVSDSEEESAEDSDEQPENGETGSSEEDAEDEEQKSHNTDTSDDSEESEDADEFDDTEEDNFDISDYEDEDEDFSFGSSSHGNGSDSADDDKEDANAFSDFMDSICEELLKDKASETEEEANKDSETDNLIRITRKATGQTNFQHEVRSQVRGLRLKDPSDKSYSPELRSLVNMYASRVERQVQREIKTRTEDEELCYQLGGTLNHSRISDYVTKKGVDKYRIFDKTFEGEEGLSIAVEILVDESGSMGFDDGGKNAKNAVAVTAILYETCHRLGIPIRVCSFSTRTYLYCDFDEPCKSSFEHRLCAYYADPMNGTDEAQALLLLEKSLFERQENYKFLFLITDGQPGFNAPIGAEKWLKEYQQYAISKGIQFVACCTGSSKNEVASIYDGPKIVYDEYDKLAERLTKEIKRAIL